MEVEFFDQIFRERGRDSLIILWAKKDNKSCTYWHSDPIAAIVDATERIEKGWDVYFCCGLADINPENNGAWQPSKKTRPKHDQIVGLGFLWADIDYKSKYHKSNEGYPTNPDEVKRILRDHVRLPYSILIHSGNGFYPFWVLDRVYWFDKPEDHQRYSNLVKDWHGFLTAVFARFGYRIDPWGNINKVLRVPGTHNYKSDPAKPVNIIEPTTDWISVPVYTPTEIGRVIAQERYQFKPAKTVDNKEIQRISGKIVASRDANPPLEMFQALYQNSPEFKRTWDRKRPDLKDGTPSGYDLTLANEMVAARWTDQQITDCIIAFRRKYSLDLDKAMRIDYLALTITKARSGLQSLDDMFEPENIDPLTGRPDPNKGVTLDRKKFILEELRRELNIPLKDVRRIGKENCRHILVMGDGAEVNIGLTEKFIVFKYCQSQIFDITKVMIPHYQPKVWAGVVERMSIIAVDENDDSASLKNEVGEWVNTYIEQSQLPQTDEWWNSIKAGRPIPKDGKIHITLNSFLKYLRTALKIYQHDKSEITMGLTALGFVPDRIQHFDKTEKKNRSRRTWSIKMTELEVLKIEERADQNES